MRYGVNDLIRIFRDINLALDELKTPQNVGSNQIVAKPYSSDQQWDKLLNIVAPFQSVGSSFRVLKIIVEATKPMGNNILISDVVPELRYQNGNRVSNWNFNNSSINLTTFFFMVPVNTEDNQKNTYVLGIIAPTDTVMLLKVHIVANAEVKFNMEDVVP